MHSACTVFSSSDKSPSPPARLRIDRVKTLSSASSPPATSTKSAAQASFAVDRRTRSAMRCLARLREEILL